MAEESVAEAIRSMSSLQLLFANGCKTLGWCRRVQDECRIPVVIGWEAEAVPDRLCVAMVG